MINRRSSKHKLKCTNNQNRYSSRQELQRQADY